jgi:RNA polymerase sigma-70 factor (ECF subfamily)
MSSNITPFGGFRDPIRTPVDGRLPGAMQEVTGRAASDTVDLHRFASAPVYMTVKTDTRQLDSHPGADWEELRARLRSFVARRLSSDPSSVEDLVQEILIRLHRGLPRLRQSERLDAFAYQVARNAIADHYRKGRREQPVAPESLVDHIVTDDGPAEDPSGTGRAELARCLRPLIDRLDPDYREALLLTDLGELSQAEAARRLSLSAPGMRSRVQRGRSQLHDALAKCCSVEQDAASQIDRVQRVGPCACSS